MRSVSGSGMNNAGVEEHERETRRRDGDSM